MLKNFSSFKYAVVSLTLSKSCLDASQYDLKFSFPIPFKDLALVEGGKGAVWFTRFIEDWEPDIYELWTFDDDGIC